MPRKITHRKKVKKSKLTAKKNKNKNMTGGEIAKQIFGFVNMVEYLKDFKPDPTSTDESKPRVIDYVDNHGAPSILCRWIQLEYTSNSDQKTYFTTDSSGNNVKTFYKFEDFIDEVIKSLKGVEEGISQAQANTTIDSDKVNFDCLSMLTKNDTGTYPYYLVASRTPNARIDYSK